MAGAWLLMPETLADATRVHNRVVGPAGTLAASWMLVMARVELDDTEEMEWPVFYRALVTAGKAVPVADRTVGDSDLIQLDVTDDHSAHAVKEHASNHALAAAAMNAAGAGAAPAAAPPMAPYARVYADADDAMRWMSYLHMAGEPVNGLVSLSGQAACVAPWTRPVPRSGTASIVATVTSTSASTSSFPTIS